MRILVEQLIAPDPGVLELSDQPPEAQPPWVSLADVQQLLGTWLVTAFVEMTATPNEMTATPKEQVFSILSVDGEFALAVRHGTFEGTVDVRRAARDILRQLAERAAT